MIIIDGNMNTREQKLEAFGRLLDILDELRVKCPWDRKQTNESLRPQTIEETYELSDAILKNDHHEICKELGDLLLHVVFYAKMGDEKGEFDIADVINHLCDKLIYRHPHVFSSTEVSSAEDVVKNWEMLKTKEKDGNKRVLSGVPESLPSMIKAKNAAKDRAEDELGDMIFALVNAGRLYKLNPDTALEKTCAKFRRRFTYLEEHTIRQGRDLKDMTLAQMDEIWDEAKRLGL